jgi:N-acetyl sugar amidotransferase
VCQYCTIHDELEKQYRINDLSAGRLANILKKIKKHGWKKKYDCVVGVSGGVDSTYTLYKAVNLGLKPLAVHFDNGWNSEIAVNNIEVVTRKLNVDLETIVADWEEFKLLQKSFLLASVSDAEIPTDVTIHAVLHQVAAQENIHYVLIGHSFRTEGVVPKTWTYMDGKYIDSVHKIFSGKRLQSLPRLTLSRLLYYWFVKKIHSIPLLNYIPYDKAIAATILEKELGWRNYGGHHHESLYTVFFQSYYLPKKFGIDKRILALSARVRSGSIGREDALEQIKRSPYPLDEKIVDYAIKKLGLSAEDFKNIMSAPIKSFVDYPTYFPLVQFFWFPLFIAYKLNLVPKILYYKFKG